MTADRQKGDRYVLFTDASGEVRWRRIAGNGRRVARSVQGYKRFRTAVDAVFRQAPDVEVVFGKKKRLVPLEVWEDASGGKP